MAEFDDEQWEIIRETIERQLDKYDENDPRSFRYKRDLIRPPILWSRVFINILASIIFAACIYYFTASVCNKRLALIVAAGFVFVLICFRLKKIILFYIKLYQRFAPETIREKCRFEPSCSQYMCMAVEKYGLFKGLHMGIDRLKRCNTNGGGIDYP